MQPDRTRQKSVFKNPLIYSSFAIVMVAAYVGYILYSRHRDNRAYEQRAREAQARKQRESDQAAIEQLGGSELAIQMLYATPKIKRGESGQVCFGVANARGAPSLVDVQHQHLRVVPARPRADVAVGQIWKD